MKKVCFLHQYNEKGKAIDQIPIFAYRFLHNGTTSNVLKVSLKKQAKISDRYFDLEMMQ
jgi:hypothetical protein